MSDLQITVEKVGRTWDVVVDDSGQIYYYPLLPVVVVCRSLFEENLWRVGFVAGKETRKIGPVTTLAEARACARAFTEHVAEVLRRSRTLTEEAINQWEKGYATQVVLRNGGIVP